MNKVIMVDIAKLSTEEAIEKYGDETLAVVHKNEEGKKIFFIPKTESGNNELKIAFSKRDLRELAKLIKDGDDDDCVEIKYLLFKEEAEN